MLSYALLITVLMICTALKLIKPHNIHQARFQWGNRIDKAIARQKHRSERENRVSGDMDYFIPNLDLLYQKKRSRSYSVSMRSNGQISMKPTLYGKLKKYITKFVIEPRTKGLITGIMISLFTIFVFDDIGILSGIPFLLGITTTWTNGGGDGKASTAANWSNGIDVDYDVVFDGTSTANCTFDYDGQLGTFTIAAGYSGTITQSSDMYITGYSQAGGTFTGVTTKWVYCSGDFVQGGGTFTDGRTNLYFTSNANITKRTSGGINTLKTDASVTFLGAESPTIYNILILDGGEFVIPSARVVYMSFNSPSSKFVNNGVISGDGTLIYKCLSADSANPNIYLNDTNVNIAFTNIVIVNFVFGLYTDGHVKSLTVSSGHAVSTCGLNLNGHSLTATTITVGTRGILSNSGALANVNCTTFDASAGTLTPDNIRFIMSGAGSIKLAAGGIIESLITRANATITLLSDVVISKDLIKASDNILPGAFALTMTDNDRLYDRHRVYHKVNYEKPFEPSPGELVFSNWKKEVSS